MIGPCCGFQTGIFNVSFPEEGEESKLLCLLLHRQQPFSWAFATMPSFLPAPTAREITIVTKEFRTHPCSAVSILTKHFEFRAVVGRKSQHGVRSLFSHVLTGHSQPHVGLPCSIFRVLPLPLPSPRVPLFPLSFDLIFFPPFLFYSCLHFTISFLSQLNFL